MEEYIMLPTLRNRFTMPSVFDELFNKEFGGGLQDTYANFNTPAVNVIENNDSFIIELAAPGLDKKDFKLDLNNNLLTISSEKEYKNEEEKTEKYMRREFVYGSFKRSFTLPESVNSEKINAQYKEGVLIIDIPKREEAKQKPPRQIAIL